MWIFNILLDTPFNTWVSFFCHSKSRNVLRDVFYPIANLFMGSTIVSQRVSERLMPGLSFMQKNKEPAFADPLNKSLVN